MTDRRPFKQRDVDLVVRAVRAAGHQAETAEINYRGEIVVVLKPLPTRGPCVYFLETSPGSAIKIGFTNGVINTRIKDLQAGCPRKLWLIAAAPAERRQETEVHRAFAADRLIGEWFKRSRRLNRLLEAVGRGDTLADILANA